MEDMTISLEEMLEFIYNRCTGDITPDGLELILDLKEDLLSSKGLINIEEDDIYW